MKHYINIPIGLQESHCSFIDSHAPLDHESLAARNDYGMAMFFQAIPMWRTGVPHAVELHHHHTAGDAALQKGVVSFSRGVASIGLSGLEPPSPLYLPKVGSVGGPTVYGCTIAWPEKLKLHDKLYKICN